MRFQTMFGAAAVCALLAGCAGGPEAELAAATAGAGGQGAGGAGGSGVVDVTSVEYFQVTVGDRVFFPTDQFELTNQARGVLDRQAEWLKQNSGLTVDIEGHADERGTREYNLALGARRANAVRAYLESRGVDAGRMNVVSFGRERPVETCSSESCWAKNRRSVTAPQG